MPDHLDKSDMNNYISNFNQTITKKQNFINPSKYQDIFYEAQNIEQKGHLAKMNNGYSAEFIGYINELTAKDIGKYLPEVNQNDKYNEMLSKDIQDLLKAQNFLKDKKTIIQQNIYSNQGVYCDKSNEERQAFINIITNLMIKVFIIRDNRNNFSYIYTTIPTTLRCGQIKNDYYFDSNGNKDKTCIHQIIMHHTAGELLATIITFMPAAQEPSKTERQVSANFVNSRSGIIIQMVNENPLNKYTRAFHSGVGCYNRYFDSNKEINLNMGNDISIGIENVNLGSDTDLFNDYQTNALIELTKYITKSNPNIMKDRIIGHADYAPRRKEDPSKNFQWQKLSQNNLAIMPTKQILSTLNNDSEKILCEAGNTNQNVAICKQTLTDIGYLILDNTKLNSANIVNYFNFNNEDINNNFTLEAAITSFKRHYTTQNLNGKIWTSQDQLIAEDIKKQIKSNTSIHKSIF